MIRRRDCIAGLGSAVAWPAVVRAQQGERVRRIGVLMDRIATETIQPASLRRFWRRISSDSGAIRS